jgi:hypothetical protein
LTLRDYVKRQRFAFVVVVKREAKGEYLPVPVMAGLVPAIHAFALPPRRGCPGQARA